MSKKPWEVAGVSRTTYYRHMRKKKAGKRPPAASVRVRTRSRVIADMQASRGPRNPTASMAPAPTYRMPETVDVDMAIATAVRKALVTDAVAQLEAMLSQVRDGYSGVLVMQGSVAKWAACAQALREAGF